MGRFFSVDVHLDWSLLVVGGLITYSLGATQLPAWHPTWSVALCWVFAVAAAIAFVASLLAHELAHLVVARAYGVAVRRIKLFLFGGLAQMGSRPPTPGAELVMAIVGPATGLAIGIAVTAAGYSMLEPGQIELMRDRPQVGLRVLTPGTSFLLWLGPINLLVAAFNLLPGFPLDGGRAVRAILWRITGDLERATAWAAKVGQGFAWVLIGGGALTALAEHVALGAWLALIGYFLNSAARDSHEQVVVRKALGALRVSQMMNREIPCVAADLPIDALVRDYLLATDFRAFPVEDATGFCGLVCLEDIRKVPQAKWSEKRTSGIMTPSKDLTVVAPDAPAELVLEQLGRHEVDQLPVIDEGRFVGLIRRADIIKWLTVYDVAPEHPD